ncbi:MAG: ABC transporter substrate-binding protein [Xanthobacteraceae bacterium]|jgi:NitT/TauT family transport system substrate-binding protein
MRKEHVFVCLVAALGLALAKPAAAQETLKLAVGQRGLWDTAVSDLGQRAGIFKKHGLTLELLYTQGAGETQQAVIAGSVDIGASVGVMGVLSAFSKGAPIRVIGAEMTGAGDLFWYVKADSPIKSLKDVGEGKTIAYSTVGSSTHGVVTAFIKQYDLKARPVATGSPPTTLTQVMSDQIDVGWSAPPTGLDLLDQGRIRILATGNDTLFKDQTVRLLLTNVQTLQTRKAAIDRYIKAYRETVDWMHDDPAALKVYADFNGISEAAAKRIRDGFFTKDAISPDRIIGLDVAVKDAVALKFTASELTKAQLAELIQIPPR